MVKINDQRNDESRADYMLKVAAAYIRENCPYNSIFYDDAECDGYCVADDCESAISENIYDNGGSFLSD